MSDELVLEMRGIRKEFPGVVANDDVSLEVRRGEVHALLGENGAGKSTLMNILYGLYKPDAGEIRMNGKPVSFGSASDAIDAGIGMVHQHFMLIPVMTVAENVVLGTEPVKDGVLLDEAAAEQKVADMAKTFKFAVDPAALVQDIGVGQQQRVEIMKALYRNADILILDEPTAVLTPQEALDLFEILRTLRREGISIVFITHKLGEVLEIADRITVLRRGKTIETVPREGATEKSLARAMVGRDVLLRVEKQPAADGRRPARGRGPLGLRRSRHREGARRLLRGARRRDRRHRRSRRERADRADRGPHRAAPGRAGRDPRRRPRAPPLVGRERSSMPGWATSPRTASAAGSCSSSRSPRTSPCTTTRSRRTRSGAGSSPAGWSSARRR